MSTQNNSKSLDLGGEIKEKKRNHRPPYCQNQVPILGSLHDKIVGIKKVCVRIDTKWHKFRTNISHSKHVS